MARRKPKDAVVRMELDSPRELLTIDADSPAWLDPTAVSPKGCRGAIVRLRPPAGAADSAVALVRAIFENAGAARVTTLPRPRAEVVPARAKDRGAAKAVGAREAILQLVDESSSKDKAALRGFCEALMAEAGL